MPLEHVQDEISAAGSNDSSARLLADAQPYPTNRILATTTLGATGVLVGLGAKMIGEAPIIGSAMVGVGLAGAAATGYIADIQEPASKILPTIGVGAGGVLTGVGLKVVEKAPVLGSALIGAGLVGAAISGIILDRK